MTSAKYILIKYKYIRNILFYFLLKFGTIHLIILKHNLYIFDKK